MDFLPQSAQPPSAPKNLYPCLAHISISAASSEPRATRRLSTGSFGSDSGEGNALTRVISGGRRMSSFGPIAGGGPTRPSVSGDTSGAHPGAGSGAGGRRLSFGGNKDKDDELKGAIEGKWYWRVQTGVTETHLILLPLSQPPNPVLTSPPAPLSHAMPAHSNHASAGIRTEGGTTGAAEDEGMIAKMKNLFRRSSTTTKDTSDATTDANTFATTGSSTGHGAKEGIEDKIIDQTSQGEMLPSAHGNAVGATNLNSSAELGWPGIINGDKLGAISIPLGAVDRSKVHLGGGKKGEGSYVTVPVNSHFSQIVHPMLDPVGQNKSEQFPKSGLIRFEFDKDWIGAKGEAELLHHHLTKALTSLPEERKERAPPQLQEFQLGGGGGTTHSGQSPFSGTGSDQGAGHGTGAFHPSFGHGHGATTTAGAPALAPIADSDAGFGGGLGIGGAGDIAPDESLGSVSTGGKVAGSERGSAY